MQMHNPKDVYTAADIERYHNGKMPPAEMHALEKAALDDPFLSDAIDGYVHTTTIGADVRFLKRRLNKRHKKVVPFFTKRQQVFFSIAAMLVLLAGFSWLAYKLSADAGRELAVQTKKETTDIKADTRRTTDKEPPVKMMKQAPVEKAKPKDAATEATAPETFSKPQALDSESIRSNNLERPAKETAQARVVDADNRAVPFATITDGQNKTLATTDTGGVFSLPVPDTGLAVAVTSSGYDEQRTTLNSSESDQKIVLQQTSDPENKIAKRESNKAVSARSIQVDGAEPAAGWNRLNASWVQQRAALDTLHVQLLKGQVSLSFDVDTNGKAMHVTIDKSLCEACDAAALRLIQDNAWLPLNKGTRVKARLPF